MAGIDYHGIKTSIKAALDGDADIVASSARVIIEDSIAAALPDHSHIVAIYATNRSKASEPIAAGQRARIRITYSIWVMVFNQESIAKAVELRDNLISTVEQVLMKDRTIGGKVGSSWLEGGELFSAKDAQPFPFVAGGEIVLQAEATISTV